MKDSSLAAKYPEIAKDWHPTKNGSLTPSQVLYDSQKKVWWLYSYDDPVSGKHFDFEWQTTVAARTIVRTGCPYLSGRAVCLGFNDLATQYPEVAKEWHPTKNGDLKPSDVVATSSRRVWWQLPYDDPESGNHFDFEWMATVVSRTIGGTGCPYLSGKFFAE